MGFLFFATDIVFVMVCFDIGIEITCGFLISGAAEVEEQDDMYFLVAPQNAVGNCIIDVRE